SSVFKALGKYLSIGSCLDRYVQVPALSRPEVDAAQPAGALFVVRGELASKGVSRVEPSSTHYDLQLLSCAKECRWRHQFDVDGDGLVGGEKLGDIVAWSPVKARDVKRSFTDAVCNHATPD